MLYGRCMFNWIRNCQTVFQCGCNVFISPPVKLFFFWPCHAACGIPVPWPGIEPAPPWIGSAESQPLDLQGSLNLFLNMLKFQILCSVCFPSCSSATNTLQSVQKVWKHAWNSDYLLYFFQINNWTHCFKFRGISWEKVSRGWREQIGNVTNNGLK